jgi:hypothetical protein
MKNIWMAGVIGGIIGACVATGAPVVAQMLLEGHRLTLRGSDGQAYLDAAKLSGSGSSLCFYANGTKAPLCLGTYSEDGLPFIGLGENPRVQAILRLAGRNQSGVLVFKDKGNHDRMILGLALDNPNEEPFLVTFDKAGKKTVHFGSY